MKITYSIKKLLVVFFEKTIKVCLIIFLLEVFLIEVFLK